MRVAIDATPLIGRRTGIGVFVAGALKALAATASDSAELAAYALSWSGRHALGPDLPAGVRTVKRPMVASVLLSAWERTEHPAIEWWTGPIEVVHGTNFVVPPARTGRVVTVHDLTCVRYPGLCTPTSLRYPALVRRAVDAGAFVHTPSAWVAAEVVELLGVPAERVRAIPHGVDHLHRTNQGSPGVRPYILGLGTTEPRKDFVGLVRAFDLMAEEVSDVELWLAGPPGWGENALGAAIGDASNKARIRRLGWVSDPAILIAQAAVFAFPSLYEGFGLPPLEAMSMGVPVVATSAGALPEVLGDAAITVPVGDPAALARALVVALTDHSGRTTLIERGLARAAGLTWEATAERLLDLYRATVL